MQTEVVSEATATSSGATVQVTTTPSRSELASVGEHDARSDKRLRIRDREAGLLFLRCGTLGRRPFIQ